MTMKSMHYKRKGIPKPSLNMNTKSEMKKQLDSDSHFCYNMTILIGSSAELETRDGKKYDGVFVACSGQQELMLEATHMIQENEQSLISKHFDSIIVPSDKVAAVTFQDVDLAYATRDFQLDGAIAGSRGLPLGDKELTPWDGSDAEQLDDFCLDIEGNKNGWEVREMFKKNEEHFGIVSSYTRDLIGYTTLLDKSDSESFRKHEEVAIQVASEIEKNTASLDRTRIENVENEEEAFSAVVREQEPKCPPSSEAGTSSGSGTGKYIPPSKRHAQYGADTDRGGNHGQPSLNGSSSQPPRFLATKKPIYGSSVRENFAQNAAGMHHNERRHHDLRRPPSLNQPVQSNLQDMRRSDEGNMLAKHNKPMKGRPDMNKTVKGLREFQQTFNSNYQSSSEGAQGRRPGPSNPQLNKPTPPNKIQLPTNIHASQPRSGPGRNFDDPFPSNKPKSEPYSDNYKSQPPVQKPAEIAEADKPITVSLQSEKGENSMDVTDNSLLQKDAQGDTKESIAAATCDAKSDISQSSDDSKSRKFTFNPHAKEFNPGAKVFNPKSPATPPRPLSDSSMPSTSTQVHGSSPSVHTYMPMQTLIYNPQIGGLVPGQSPAVSVGNTQRSGGHRKGGLMGQRSEMQQQIPLQSGVPPLIGSGALQHNGLHPHYGLLPHVSHAIAKLQSTPPGLLPMYSEPTNNPQMQFPLHYYPHGASPTQPNTAHHTQGGNTVNVPVPNPHGYSQTHQYPFVGIQMGWNPNHNNSQQVVATTYVPHGGAGGIPHG